jgi:hypothetical protein
MEDEEKISYSPDLDQSSVTNNHSPNTDDGVQTLVRDGEARTSSESTEGAQGSKEMCP